MGFGGHYTTEPIAVGVADEQIVPISSSIRAMRSSARYGVGTPIARSARTACWLASQIRRDAGFFSLRRFGAASWVNDWLARRDCGDWLSQMDRTMPITCPTLWTAMAGGWQGLCGLEEVYRAIDGLCRPLRGKPRRLADWPEPILDLLVAVFGGRPLTRMSNPTGRSWLLAANCAT